VWGRELRCSRELGIQESIARTRLMDSGSGELQGNLSLRPLGGVWKRSLDVVLAGMALLLLMPLMGVAATLLRLLMEGSIILSEPLIGRGGRIFSAYKFRTPLASPETTSRWVNNVAGTLRDCSLDKLPRLFNVLCGQMSLVGPRPRAAAELSDYFAQPVECLRARPGLISSHHKDIDFDRYYVSHWSMGLDLALLTKAILAIRSADMRTFTA
jgi:exopolysaccharide production protein ExoY